MKILAINEFFEEKHIELIKKGAAEDGLLFRTMQIVMEKILHHLRRRADSVSGKLHIECATFTTQLGLLAESEGFKQALAAHVHF